MNRDEINNGLVLGGATAVALSIIVFAFILTGPTIEKTNHDQLSHNLNQLLVANSYDNNPTTDSILMTSPALGSNTPQPIYRARAGSKPSGAVVTAIAPNGYNGAIHLLIGFSLDGNVVAVRVTEHRETPGLGDDIDERRSNWIRSFDGLSPDAMQSTDWQVKKDGGQFDQFTGATITPRAVIHSVHKVSQWYRENQQAIFTDEK